MFGLGIPEIVVILLVIVVIFGAQRIPEIGSALGKSLRSFKEEIKQPERENDEK